MKTFKKIIVFVSILFLSITIYTPIINAHVMDDFWPDSDARWELFGSHIHMGYTQTTYKYFDSTVKESYEEYVDDGKVMWGSFITMTETGVGYMGVIDAEEMPGSSANAVTTIPLNPPTNHVATWTITINPLQFDDEEKEDSGRIRTLAHEIGHVFGLGHISDAYDDQIMYRFYDEEKEVTSYDEMGMKVCTEAHTVHAFSYLQYNDTQHKKKCVHCDGYYLEDHTWADANDTTCNDCEYIREMEITVNGSTHTVNLDGQTWTVCYSETGTQYEWSQNPPKFDELHGYSTTYSLPKGGTLTWGDIGSEGDHEYCMNYDSDDYYLGYYQKDDPASFHTLKVLTHIKKYYYQNYYIREIDNDPYHKQVREYEDDLTGIFYAKRYGTEEYGFYIIITRALVDSNGDYVYHNSVWKPEIEIPVYYSE